MRAGRSSPAPADCPTRSLRTYTDGLWTADHLPPVRVLAALSQAVDLTELQRAVREAMLARADQAQGAPSLTWGQRVMLEALREFDDDVLVETAPHVHDLLATLAAAAAPEQAVDRRHSTGPAANRTTRSRVVHIGQGPRR